MSPERLQKVLARAGIASRRECEALIADGRVAVNGRVVRTLGARVDPEQDELTLDGQPVSFAAARTYVLLNKPSGVISTAEDTHDRTTVLDLVDVPVRVYPIGRLDKDSEGLLLLTDDGELTQCLTHPSYAIEKEYRALLDQTPSPDALRQWREGVELDGQMTMPAWVEVTERTDTGTWVNIVLHEGRKRQIREVARLLGYEVVQLRRVREGPITLGELPLGAWRHLTEEEVAALWDHAEEAERTAERAERAAQRAEEKQRGRRTADRAGTDVRRSSPTGERPRRHGAQAANGARRAPRTDGPTERAARDNRSYRSDRPSREGRTYRDERDSRSDRPSREGRLYRDERDSRSDRPSREGRSYRDERGPRGGRDERADRRPRRYEARSDQRPPRDDRGRYGRADDRAPGRSRADRPDRGNEALPERSTGQGRASKPAPSRAWHARQEQEEQARRQRGMSSRAGRTNRPNRPTRSPRRRTDDESEQ